MKMRKVLLISYLILVFNQSRGIVDLPTIFKAFGITAVIGGLGIFLYFVKKPKQRDYSMEEIDFINRSICKKNPFSIYFLENCIPFLKNNLTMSDEMSMVKKTLGILLTIKKSRFTKIDCMSPSIENVYYHSHKVCKRNDLKRGNIISVSHKGNNLHKRLIGLPGDHIEGKIEDGKSVIYVNGEKLEEPYVNKYKSICVMNKETKEITLEFYDEYKKLESHLEYLCKDDKDELIRCPIFFKKLFLSHDPDIPIEQDIFDVILKENEGWIMGDNRVNSDDSRFIGPVELDDLVVKSEYVENPFSQPIFNLYKAKVYSFLKEKYWNNENIFKTFLKYVFNM